MKFKPKGVKLFYFLSYIISLTNNILREEMTMKKNLLIAALTVVTGLTTISTSNVFAAKGKIEIDTYKISSETQDFLASKGISKEKIHKLGKHTRIAENVIKSEKLNDCKLVTLLLDY